MRQQGNNQRRPRGRTNRKPQLSPRSHTFDSNGPDVRVRGNAHQVYEKYLNLARDAASSGDRIAAESYYQFAEHYFRLLNDSTDPQRSGDPQRGGGPRDHGTPPYRDGQQGERSTQGGSGPQPDFGPRPNGPSAAEGTANVSEAEPAQPVRQNGQDASAPVSIPIKTGDGGDRPEVEKPVQSDGSGTESAPVEREPTPDVGPGEGGGRRKAAAKARPGSEQAEDEAPPAPKRRVGRPRRKPANGEDAKAAKVSDEKPAADEQPASKEQSSDSGDGGTAST